MVEWAVPVEVAAVVSVAGEAVSEDVEAVAEEAMTLAVEVAQAAVEIVEISRKGKVTGSAALAVTRTLPGVTSATVARNQSLAEEEEVAAAVEEVDMEETVGDTAVTVEAVMGEIAEATAVDTEDVIQDPCEEGELLRDG